MSKDTPKFTSTAYYILLYNTLNPPSAYILLLTFNDRLNERKKCCFFQTAAKVAFLLQKQKLFAHFSIFLATNLSFWFFTSRKRVTKKKALHISRTAKCALYKCLFFGNNEKDLHVWTNCLTSAASIYAKNFAHNNYLIWMHLSSERLFRLTTLTMNACGIALIARTGASLCNWHETPTRCRTVQ